MRTGVFPSQAVCCRKLVARWVLLGLPCISPRAHELTLCDVHAQDEIKEKEEAEAKAKADSEAGEDPSEEQSLAQKLIGYLEGAFDIPALAPHKHLLQPLFDLLQQHEALIFGVVAAPLLLLLASLGLLGGSKVALSPLTGCNCC